MWTVLVLGLAARPPWRDPRVHVLGNHGCGGLVHAAVAMPVTRLIDAVAYDGRDVRRPLREERDSIDLGCGVGLSTGRVGVDCSAAMLRAARALHPSKTFYRGLAERWGRPDMTDCVTVSFVLHEQSSDRRLRILRNAHRIARSRVLVLDIDPDYVPSRAMRLGEPYIDDYLARVDDEVHGLFPDARRVTVVDGHAVLWEVRKTV